MAKPNKFLQDIYEGLEADHVGALAMVYQAGDMPCRSGGLPGNTKTCCC